MSNDSADNQLVNVSQRGQLNRDAAVISRSGADPSIHAPGLESAADIVSYFRPEYTATIQGKTLVSTSVIDLIKQGASTEIDFPALNVFLRTGFYIGTNTAFRAIHTKEVPDPASFRITPMEWDRPTIIDGYIELFRQAIQAQIKQCGSERVCMGLSGGRDSRHILLELCRVGAKPDLCWTVDFVNAPSEMAIAGSLTRRLGVVHRGVPAAASVVSERYKNQATSFESVEHGWVVTALPLIRPHRVIYDGMAGDVLSAGLFLTEEGVRLVSEGRIDEFLEKIIVSSRPIPLVRDQSLFPLEGALEQVSAEFRRHMTMPNPIGSFYLWNRTRRTIGSYAFALLCPTGQHTCAPYLDTALFRFLCSIPDSLLVDHGLHTDTIRKAFPEHADIGFSHKIKAPELRLRNRMLAIDTARYLLSRHSPLPKKGRALLSLLRALAMHSQLPDVDWVHTISVYLTQLGCISEREFAEQVELSEAIT
jgi:asparagine synthase (glutamine-hydrolysing)